jgi:serine/threonine protein kinase
MSYSQLYFYDMTFCQLDLHKYISTVSQGTDVSMTFFKVAGEKSIFGIVADVTRGLNFLHSHGQIHGNLKPSNGCPQVCQTNESIVLPRYSEVEG